MMTKNDFTEALKEAIRRAGTQSELARRVGLSQGTVSDYLNGRCSVGNMTVSTLLRFFPDMRIDFFQDGGNVPANLLRSQILEIFDSTDDRGKVRMLAKCAANFGEALKENTK